MNSLPTQADEDMEVSLNSSLNFSGFGVKIPSTEVSLNSSLDFSGFGVKNPSTEPATVVASEDIADGDTSNKFSSTRRLSNVLPETIQFNVSNIAINEEDAGDSSMTEQAPVVASEDMSDGDTSMQSVNTVDARTDAREDDLVSNNISGMHSGMDFSLESSDIILPITPSVERLVEDVINTTLENQILEGMVFNPVPLQGPEDGDNDDFLSFTPTMQPLQGDLPCKNILISKGASRINKYGEYGAVLVAGRYPYTHTMNKPRSNKGQRDGFTYSCTKRLGDDKCKGKWHVFEATAKRLEKVDDTDIIEVIDREDIKCLEEHSKLCVPDVGIVERILYIRECKAMAADPEYNFEDAMKIVGAAKGKHGISEAIKEKFPKDINVCKMINRVRKDSRAVAPKQDGSDMLTWEFITDHLPPSMRHFYRGDSTAETKVHGIMVTRRSFIFFSDQQKTALKQIREAKIDGTFKVVDTPHFQLVSVHGTIPRPGPDGDTVNKNTPLAYIVMQGKSEADYTSAFKKLKSLVEDDGEPMMVKTFIVDYERAFWNAIRRTWDNVTVRGCWFHFNQCIFRKVQEFKIEHSYNKQLRGYKMVRRLMTLALIHPNNIPQLFDKIKLMYAKEINDPEFCGFQKLFAYFETQWINGIFKPDDWSCYMKEIRTTNQVERWNGHIYVAGGKKKLNIHLLAQLLGKDAVYAMNKIDEYSKKVYRKRAQVAKEKAITDAYEDFTTVGQVHHGNAWNLLEKLYKATTLHCRFSVSDINTSEPLPETTENV